MSVTAEGIGQPPRRWRAGGIEQVCRGDVGPQESVGLGLGDRAGVVRVVLGPFRAAASDARSDCSGSGSRPSHNSSRR